MKTLPIALLLLLTSCADFQARMAAQQAANAQAAAVRQQAINDADDAQCSSYGAKPGSDAYVACRMNLANNRQQAAEAAADRSCAAASQMTDPIGAFYQAQCAARSRP